MDTPYVEESFEYMLHHDLIDGDRIKHFSIHVPSRTRYEHVSFNDVQSALVLWIKQEGERLRQRDNWNIIPCDKVFGGGHFVLGYNSLFPYEKYEFRLRLDDWCVDMYCCCEIDREDCDDCDNESEEPSIHFELMREIKMEPIKVPIKREPYKLAEAPIIKREPDTLAEEFKMIPCEPVLEWDDEL